MEVSILNVVVVGCYAFCKRIELNVATAVRTGPLRHREAQMAECAAQVDGLAGNRSCSVDEGSLDVTDVSPILGIVTTLNVHTSNVTVRSITTSNIYLNESGNGFVKGNLQIRNCAVSPAVITVPVCCKVTVDETAALELLTVITRIRSVT